MLTRRTFLAASAAASADRVFASTEEPLRLLVAYPPGGPTDVLARQMEPLVHRALNRPVVVDNVPGAAGGLGVQRLLSSARQSPSVLVGSPSETLIAPLVNRALTYQPEQLRLVGVVSYLPVALVGGAHLAEPDLAALLARRPPAATPCSYASYGVGSHGHLVGEDFSARSGLGLLHVPYGGVAPAVRDLVGGRVDLAFLPLTAQIHDLVDQGRLRLYGLASSRASLRTPSAVRIEQQPGFAGFRHDLWSGVFVARAAPAPVAAQAQKALHAVLGHPAFVQLKKDEGLEVAAPSTSADAEAWFDAEVLRYRSLLQRITL